MAAGPGGPAMQCKTYLAVRRRAVKPRPARARPTSAIVPVATSEVFAELDSRADLKTRPTSPLSAIPDLPDVHALAAYLDQQRNDLEYPAMLVCPEIGQVASALSERQGCLLARMSGSGGTCFGLFADEDSAYWAARMIGHQYQHWWVQATRLLA